MANLPMTKSSPFVVSDFTNPSGAIVYRVSGWRNGKRYRKNHETLIEAQRERNALEAERLALSGGPRAAMTRLTESQLHEAEAVSHSRAK